MTRRSIIGCSSQQRGKLCRLTYGKRFATKRGRSSARVAVVTTTSMSLLTCRRASTFVYVFVDDSDAIWVGVHFGSRGLGHTIASGFLALSQGAKWGERVPEREVLLPLRKSMGHDYWELMTLAGEYAYAGREWVARKVASLLGGRELELVHNHHNFAWREEHDEETFIVIRKGATPAFPGQKGFVGGSMGDNAVIVQGTHAENDTLSELQRNALFSTVHGAGRVMSRSAAAGKINRRTGEVLKPRGILSALQ